MNSKIDVVLSGGNEEFRPYLNAMSEMISLLRHSERGGLFDYGSGPCVWSYCASKFFSPVFAIDINDSQLQRAKNFLEQNQATNIELIDPRSFDLEEIGPQEAMISIMVIELAGSDEVIKMCTFAGQKLRKGGRFLCMSRRPIGCLKSILMVDQIRLRGLVKGVYRTLALIRSAVEAIISPQIKNIPRARFFHTPGAVISLGKKSGLALRMAPAEFQNFPPARKLEGLFGPRFMGIRTVDWYVFEKI